MNIKNFLVMLLAIIAAVTYSYYAVEEKPEKAVTATPGEYIEMVERKKNSSGEKTDP